MCPCMAEVKILRRKLLFPVRFIVILYNKGVKYLVDCNRSVARKETLGVHQKNWVCHIYCQINAQKKQACLLGINMLV